MEKIIELADYVDENFNILNNTIYLMNQRAIKLESRYTMVENQFNNLETYLTNNKSKTIPIKEKKSVRSQAIGLLKDLYNPNKPIESKDNKPISKLSIPPPPPKARIVQNNHKPIINKKPSHNDLMTELKKKFELLKNKNDE
jgi:hypothetical protein